jgi:SM-20-related protein
MVETSPGQIESPEVSGARNFTTLDPAALEAVALVTNPYEFVFAENTIRKDMQEALLADAPIISAIGSMPLSKLNYGPCFQGLIDDLQSTEFRRIVERKFNIGLNAFPTTISVRGNLSLAADGHIHTDLKEKVISVLLYLNPVWRQPGGSLRVLRSRDIHDFELEIPAVFGNMLIFRRSERSWHGHLPYQGPRLSVQFNWVRSLRRRRQYWRHRFNFLKKYFPV